MDSTAIVKRTSEAQNIADLPGLLRDLKTADPDLLFRTLFPIGSSAQDGGRTPVAFSAYVVHALDPPCDMTIETAIETLIQNNWDVSIEEMPWYLASQFGSDNVIAAAKTAIDSPSNEGDRIRLETVIYWAKLAPTAG